MKNILGNTYNLELFNSEGKRIYEFGKGSNGYSYEYIFDLNGNVLSYKNSDGVKRGFDITEYTMEELVQNEKEFVIKELFEEFKKNNCKHENVKREDGLDKCLDCGIKNY